MDTALHPGVEPAATALDALPPAQPIDAAEYADILKSLNNLTGPCLLTALGSLLDRLAVQAAGPSPADRSLIAEHLEAASALLATVGERIDRARALTGWWS